MWHILKTEMNYNKTLFIIALFLIPFIAIQVTYPVIEDLPVGMLVFVVMFLALQNWAVFKNKENRDYQQVRLPISNRQVAMARIGIVVLIGLIVCIIYWGFQLILKPQGPISYRSGLVPYGIVIAFFSIYFLFRDLLLNAMRNNRIFQFTRERSKTLLISIVLILNLLGFYFFFSAAKQQLDFIGGIFRFFVHHPLVTTPSGIFIWMASSLIMACLTIVTYRLRKSYLE